MFDSILVDCSVTCYSSSASCGCLFGRRKVRDCATGSEIANLLAAESELLQYLVVVLANFRGAPCRHLSNIVHLHGTADRELQVLSGAIDRHDDVVLS